MALQPEEITRIFLQEGAAQYGGEAVTQLQHALQCAHLAELSGAGPELITAALLHDLGHLLSTKTEVQSQTEDDVHQYIAIPFLRGVFPDAVIEPIRLHVDAKRYLCMADAGYWAALSPTSQRSLELQGGPFSPEQAAAFIERPYATDAVALRRWDDQAKNPAATPPTWVHYAALMRRACLQT